MDLQQPSGLVKVIMWAPWCALVLTSLLIAQLPWWGVLLIAGFGWQDFMKTTWLWVAIAFGVAITGGVGWVQFERTVISALIVGMAAIPGFFLIKKAGLLDVSGDVSDEEAIEASEKSLESLKKLRADNGCPVEDTISRAVEDDIKKARAELSLNKLSGEG